MAGLAGGGSTVSVAYAPDPDDRRDVAADLSETVARSGARKDVVWMRDDRFATVLGGRDGQTNSA